MVAPLLHAYVYGGVPPVTVRSNAPSLPGEQLTSVLSTSRSNGAGAVMFSDAVHLQPVL